MQLAPRQLDLFRARTAGALPVREPTVPSPPPAPAPAKATAVALTEAPPLLPEPPAPSRAESLKRARVLAQHIASRLGPEVKVQLSVHDNRSTMISFRRAPPVLKIRVHHMFLDAPPAIIDAVADYAGRGKRDAGQALDDFISGHQAHIRALPRKPAALESRGACFDLQTLFDELNAGFFQGGIRARIGWGRQTARRRRKSIRLGVYDHKAREIRIHPALDRPDVPRFFVEYIVFHEMLHQLFPSDRPDGRNVHHPRAFRDRERAFPKYGAAIAWEKQHLNQLLRF